MTIDTEAMAKAMFVALHAAMDRVRNWDLHPDQDAGTEHGRNAFRTMAAAAAAVVTAPAFQKIPAGGVTVLTEPQAATETIIATGVLTADAAFVLPDLGRWKVENRTAGPFKFTVRTARDAGDVDVPQGTGMWVYADGRDVKPDLKAPAPQRWVAGVDGPDGPVQTVAAPGAFAQEPLGTFDPPSPPYEAGHSPPPYADDQTRIASGFAEPPATHEPPVP